MKKKTIPILAITIILLSVAFAKAEDKSKDKMMEQIVTTAGSLPTIKGSPDIFTGDVTVESIYSMDTPSRNTGAYVTFNNGARSSWHTHPAGQTLVVTSGVAWVQEWGGKTYEARVGDVINCPPKIKHWHGASADYPMTHFSVVENIDGKNVEWLEKVSDEQYRSAGRFIADSRKSIELKNNVDKVLTQRQISLIKVTAFSTVADIPKLKVALNDALSAGLTINEINEVLIQLYAYSGFPRSLNAITAFMDIANERQKNGIKDKRGNEAKLLAKDIDKSRYGNDVRAELSGSQTVAGWQNFAPGVELFLKEHLFADIFGRGLLTYQERELVTVTILSCLNGVNPQLKSHLNMAMNTGLTEKQIKATISIIDANIGKKVANNFDNVYNDTLLARKK